MEKFLDMIGENVGRSAKALNVAELIKSVSSKGLIIHDQDDIEVPYSEALAIKENWKGSRLLSTSGYGHRWILRQSDVWDSILKFIKS